MRMLERADRGTRKARGEQSVNPRGATRGNPARGSEGRHGEMWLPVRPHSGNKVCAVTNRGTDKGPCGNNRIDARGATGEGEPVVVSEKAT